MPKKLRIWLAAINTAAPLVNPMTTVCEMKFTTAPRRAKPSASWKMPTCRVSVRARPTYSGVPGSARLWIAAKSAIDIAVVGPDTRCHDEPKRAATMAGTIAAYRPYCGGRPAMVAKATPWGRTIRAPVKPASRSSRRVSRLTSGHQARKGSSRRMTNAIFRDVGILAFDYRTNAIPSLGNARIIPEI